MKARREDPGALSRRPSEQGALRELLPQGLSARGRPLDLASPHDAPAPRRARSGFALADGLRRRRTRPARDQGDLPGRGGIRARRRLHPDRRRGARAGLGEGLDRRRRPPRLVGPQLLGRCRAAPPPPQRAHVHGEAAADEDAEPAPVRGCSRAGSRSPARRSSSTDGPGWSATTGAPSTPSAGPGSRPPTWAETRATTSTSRRAGSSSGR